MRLKKIYTLFRFPKEPTSMKSEIPDVVTVDDFANLIGCTSRHVRNLISQRIITSAGRGKIMLPVSIRGLVDHARQSSDRDAEAASRAALNNIRHKREQTKLAVMAGEYIPVDEAAAVLDEVIATLRLALETMPARVGGDDFALRRRIEAARDEALSAASEKLENLSRERKKK
jgi:hypothetical protein